MEYMNMLNKRSIKRTIAGRLVLWTLEILAGGLLLTAAVLYWIAGLASELVGADFDTVFSWGMGIAVTVATVWLILKIPNTIKTYLER